MPPVVVSVGRLAMGLLTPVDFTGPSQTVG